MKLLYDRTQRLSCCHQILCVLVVVSIFNIKTIKLLKYQVFPSNEGYNSNHDDDIN